MLTASEQQQESNITKNHTVTIVNDNHIVSHYDVKLRSELKVGCYIYVKFPDIDENTQHTAKVIYINEKFDYVLMETESVLTTLSRPVILKTKNMELQAAVC